MAKQSGVIKVKGKVDGLVYYESQNGGNLVRKQNAGMSERVKTAPEFANTRLNAAEFGAAGRLAGRIVSVVSSRWRYILSPVATGLLAKDIKEAMAQDATHPWGRRQLLNSQMDAIQDRYNDLSKNPMWQEVRDYVEGYYINMESHEVVNPGDELGMSADLANVLLSQGADGFNIRVYTMAVSVPTYDPSIGGYTQNRGALSPMYSDFNEIGEGNTILPNLISLYRSPRGDYSIPQNDTGMRGLLIVIEPFKTINGTTHTLQELCTAYWKSLPINEGE